ncbi:VOC family protein [Rudaeicoccus suwonensis]|nr:VOC family protein [Rudaeicoccus suwonensis]
MAHLTTCLWFDDQAEEAAQFYQRVLGATIGSVSRCGEGGPLPAGSVLTVEFTILGQHFLALNGGPLFTPNEAVSFQIPTDNQDATDRLWGELIADGGQPSQCGWCRDRFGFWWQVVPTRLPELLSDPDAGRAQRAMAAMMTMGKIDIAAIEAAAGAG